MGLSKKLATSTKLRYGGRERGRSLGSAAAGPLSAPRGKATHHKCKHPELALELELEPQTALPESLGQQATRDQTQWLLQW